MRLLLPALIAAGPALADDLDNLATIAFSAAFSGACNAAFAGNGALIEPPRRYSVTSASTYGGAPVPMEIWLFRCNIGAYNMQSVVIAHSDFNGVVPMAFARPDLDIVLEDPDDPDGAVREVGIAGWSASPFVVNAEFDPGSGELRENAYWRGLGDASSTTVWRLVDEGFRLVRQDVDPTYDGEVNPVTLVSFD